MSTAAVTVSASTWLQPQDELHEELRHIRDLVFVRNLLRDRRATPTELREYDAVIDEARTQLAESAKRASARYATAA